MNDLFSFAAGGRYPAAPGFKERDTSRKAAESMKPTAAQLREQCFAALRRKGDATADEIAGVMGLSVLSVRPRFTELLHEKRIVDTGMRRRNDSGRSAKVWRLA